MANVLYTTQAHVTGGRVNGHGVTSDGQLDVQLRLPSEMGGQGDGTNPEELFAVGFAACFESALAVAGRRAKADLGEVAIDSQVTLTPNDSRGFDLGVVLDVSLPDVADQEQAIAIVRDADQICPYSNATRGNIEVKLSANGAPVQ